MLRMGDATDDDEDPPFSNNDGETGVVSSTVKVNDDATDVEVMDDEPADADVSSVNDVCCWPLSPLLDTVVARPMFGNVVDEDDSPVDATIV